MSISRKHFLVGGLASASIASLLGACSDDGDGGRDSFGGSESSPTGDGDGDPTSGDGDGDPTSGDGDGDPTSGDGDGDPTSGDGDGDPTSGDGDGDTAGDGDGDPTSGDGDGDTAGDGDGDTSGDGDGDVELVCPDGASGTILGNHGHTLLISQADVEAGIQKEYNIQGGANHSHTLTLTGADFGQLALGNEVQKQSSFLVGHDHLVLIACLL